MLRIVLFSTLFVMFMPSAQAIEYQYQEMAVDTPATRYCYPITKAKDLSADHYTLDRFAKRFCDSLGVGWHVDKRKADGVVICTPCTGDQAGEHQCFMHNLVLNCKRIKPNQ